MELSTVLLALTGFSLALFVIRLARSPAKQVADWWVAASIVAAIGGAAWAIDPGRAGYVAFAALITLVFAPLRIDRAAQVASRMGEEKRAVWLARLAAILHPLGVIRSRPRALQALAEIRRTGELDEARLEALGGKDDPQIGEWYRIIALHASGDMQAIRAALAVPSRRHRMLQIGLGATWVRTVAETSSSTLDVIAAIEEAEKTDATLDDAERRAMLALEACAALGDVEATRKIGAHLQTRLPKGSVPRAIAAAQLAAGESFAARRTIVEALRDESLDPVARRFLERLERRAREEPGAPRARIAAADATVARLLRETEAAEALAPLAGRTRSVAWVTYGLALAIVGFYAFVATRGSTTDPRVLEEWGGLVVPMIDARQAPRLFTATLLHAGLLHLGFNVYALVAFGRFVESFFGRVRLLVLWVIATLTSGLGVAALADAMRPQILVGASGAIFGLGGAVIAALLLRAEIRQSRRGKEELRSLAVLVVMQLVFDRVVPNVSGTAHVCGLLGGALAGAVLLPRRRADQAKL